jgi:glutamyl-tRNA reductase
MKQAARHAKEAGALGTHLHQLFQRSFAVAKEVRTRTDIGAAAVSMAAAGVRLAQRVFPDLGRTRLLFIGAGEMIELAATHFAAQHPSAMVIANRTLERAERLANRFGARAMRLAQLPGELERFDIVVSCTAATLPIVGLGMVERASRARAGKPLFILDLAVPRDVEAEAARLPNVFLHTVDDLAELVKTGLSSRQAAVAQAEAIIETGVTSFMQWLKRRRAVPLVQAVNAHAELVRKAELQRAHRRLERGEPLDKVLASFSNTLSNKLLHGPRAVLARGTLAPEDAQRLADQCIGMRRVRI